MALGIIVGVPKKLQFEVFKAALMIQPWLENDGHDDNDDDVDDDDGDDEKG